MLVDSHCHLDRVDLAPYGGDFAQLIAASRDAGIERMLCVSIDLESYPDMLALVDPYTDVSVSVGVHPSEQGAREPDAQELARLARHPRNVAIGETGLDYYRADGDLEWQRQRFRTHIQAARLAQKPLIIHTRAARDDTIAILRDEKAAEVGGVMHCFTETWAMAEAALAMNFYISFSGIVTFKNADALRDVASKVPLDRLLIETDSPYLAPVPFRGKPNEPRYVIKVAETLAELRDLPVAQLVAQSRDNYYRLFGPPAA